jgi:hypothetical protein
MALKALYNTDKMQTIHNAVVSHIKQKNLSLEDLSYPMKINVMSSKEEAYNSIEEYIKAVKTNKKANTQEICITQKIFKREIVIYLVAFDKDKPHITKTALNAYNDRTTINVPTIYLIRMEGYYNLLSTAVLYN